METDRDLDMPDCYARVDWHEVERLIARGCALEIVR